MLYTLLEWGLPLYLALLTYLSLKFGEPPESHWQRAINGLAAAVSGIACLFAAMFGLFSNGTDARLDHIHLAIGWASAYFAIGLVYAIGAWFLRSRAYHQELLGAIKGYIKTDPTQDIFKPGANCSKLANYIRNVSCTEAGSLLDALGLKSRIYNLPGYSPYQYACSPIRFEELVETFYVETEYLMLDFGPWAALWPLASVAIMFELLGKSGRAIWRVSKITDALKYCSRRRINSIIAEAEAYRQTLLEKQ